MTVGIFGPALAYDHASKRGVAGVVCKVLDAVTGIPLDALNLDGSAAPVVTNSQGYVPEFVLDPAPLLVIVEAGAIRMPMMNLSMVMDSSQAAIDAVQAAQDAAALVDAPADTVIKTLVEGGSTQTRGALELIFQKLLPLVTASADGIMRKADKEKLDKATPSNVASTIAMRDGNGRLNTADPAGATHAANQRYVDALAVGVALPSKAHDLNDYVTPGIFLQPANAGASAGNNYPVKFAGKLDVKTQGSITWQTYQGYQARSQFFWRSLYGTIWSEWKEAADAATVSDNLAVLVNSIAGIRSDLGAMQSSVATIGELVGSFYMPAASGSWGIIRSLTSTVTTVAWIAPFRCTIISATLLFEYHNLPASGTNFVDISLRRRKGDTAAYDTIVTKDTRGGTSGEAIVARKSWAFDQAPWSNQVFEAGDQLCLHLGGFAGTATIELPALLTFRYEPA